MKNLLYPILILTTSICGNLHAQGLPPQEIRRIYQDSINGAVPAQIIATADCGFVVAGAFGQQGFLLKLNASGDILWKKSYLFGDETAFNGLTELPSGDLVAIGQCSNCAPGDTTQKALAILTDDVGSIQKDTTFGRLNYNASATAVITTTEGSAALTGSFVLGSFLSPSNGFLTVLDENFNPVIWEEYNELYYDVLRALAQASDGGYILAGYSNVNLASPAQAQLFRTDEQGQLLWKNTSVYFSSWFNSVQEAPDGRIVALGRRQVDTINQTDVYLAVHSLENGSSLLDTTYGSPAMDDGYSLHTLEEGGFLAAGSWGAPSQSGWGRRDWVFRLNENFDIVDEYFDDGYLANYNMVNAIPLSPDGRGFACFSRVVIFSNRQNLFYKRSLQGRQARLSKAPRHYQLLPRNLATNMGTAVFEGSLETPGIYDEMRLKIFQNNALLQIMSDFTPQSFSFEVEIPAELASYSFKLIGVKNGQEYPEAEANEVVAGDAYIIQGQSNARANSEWAADSAYAYLAAHNPYVRTFGLVTADDTLMHWHNEAYTGQSRFADIHSGQWGLVMAKQIVAEQGIPIAILNGGIGGISIDNMLPDPDDPHSLSHSYGQFYQRLNRSGLRSHIRAILFFQGETNALPGYNETVDSYKNKYLQLRSAWQSDFTFEREYFFQIRPGCWDGNFSIIQEAERQLALELPNAGIMSSTGMEHNGCHYHFRNGYERAGQDIYRLLAQDFYGAPPMPDVHPPTVDSAWFSQCSRQEIILRLQHEGDVYEWTPGWETDFRLEGVANTTIASGQISGNRITLFLSEPPATSFTGITYTGHSLGSGAPVKNANGIGLLGFNNFPVTPPEPLIESFSRGICPGERFELPDGRVVDEPGKYISEFISLEGCDSLIVTELVFYDPPASPGLEVQPVSCYGQADGVITAFPDGGTPPYTYLWSDGQTSATAIGLAPGVYTLTLTDSNGCEAVVEVEISALAYEPDLTIEQDGDTLTVAEEGAGYQWIKCSNGEEIPGATGRSFAFVESGAYAVIVTDSSGACRDTSECLMVVGLEGPGQRLLQATAFPNPNNGQFTLSLPWAAEAWLYDAMGQLDYRNRYGRGNHQVFLNKLLPGVYFLRLQSGNEQQVLKLVIY